ncbi:MAG: TrmH family RNA methyltransferase, partial [Candidatus Rokuibacteriota bacterium]
MRTERIDDATDVRVDDYRQLQGPRRAGGLIVAEGALVVRRLLAQSHHRVRSVLATPAALDNVADALVAAPGIVTVFVAPPALVREIVGFKFHRGCVALGERAPDRPVADVLAAPGPRILLALENLADPDNVGAVFRNAAAFGADGVLLSPGAADPLSRKALRASMAAALTMPFARVEDWPVGLADVREAGYALAALAPDGAVDIADWPASRPVRLALLV